jgi:hypothetical protein
LTPLLRRHSATSILPDGASSSLRAAVTVAAQRQTSVDEKTNFLDFRSSSVNGFYFDF